MGARRSRARSARPGRPAGSRRAARDQRRNEDVGVENDAHRLLAPAPCPTLASDLGNRFVDDRLQPGIGNVLIAGFERGRRLREDLLAHGRSMNFDKSHLSGGESDPHLPHLSRDIVDAILAPRRQWRREGRSSCGLTSCRIHSPAGVVCAPASRIPRADGVTFVRESRRATGEEYREIPPITLRRSAGQGADRHVCSAGRCRGRSSKRDSWPRLPSQWRPAPGPARATE